MLKTCSRCGRIHDFNYSCKVGRERFFNERKDTEAAAAGVEENFFFITTFERYLKQLSILDELSETIKKKSTLVEQTYVKGRSNTVINPAIRAYNSTTDSANKTVSTLMRIINGFGDTGDDTAEDPLLKIINGG